ncbi:MAG: hypothetical protein JWQ35_2287 [Bacteriovoracaceae bacterium]|nr:hypothetical protein [Bacteriovoracaceae bacterium]
MNKFAFSFIALSITSSSISAVDSSEDFLYSRSPYCNSETHTTRVSADQKDIQQWLSSLYEYEYDNGKLISTRYNDLDSSGGLDRQILKFDSNMDIVETSVASRGQFESKSIYLMDPKHPHSILTKSHRWLSADGKTKNETKKEIQSTYDSQDRVLDQKITLHTKGQSDQIFKNHFTYDDVNRITTQTFCETGDEDSPRYGDRGVEQRDELGLNVTSDCYLGNQLLEHSANSYYEKDKPKDYLHEVYESGKKVSVDHFVITIHGDLEDYEIIRANQSIHDHYDNLYDLDAKQRIVKHTSKKTALLNSSFGSTKQTEEIFTYDGDRLMTKTSTETQDDGSTFKMDTIFDYACFD